VVEEKIIKELSLHFCKSETEIKDVFNNIKHIPEAMKFIEFALESKMDLKNAEDFFLKMYSNDN
jgi:hypothetical protein